MCLTSLRVRIPLRVLCCDATTGNGPVLKTGDPRRRTGGSSPSHSALQTWLNWQKHLPAKEGPGDRHAGSRPAVCVYCQLLLTGRDYSRFYTRSLMTTLLFHAIVGSEFKSRLRDLRAACGMPKASSSYPHACASSRSVISVGDWPPLR